VNELSVLAIILKMISVEQKPIANNFDDVHFKYSEKKWDAHVHLYRLEDTAELIKYASEYRVEKFTAIVREDWHVYEKAFPHRFVYARFIASQHLFNGHLEQVLDDIQAIYDAGYSLAKFWYSPRWRKYVEERYQTKVNGFRIDSLSLDPIFRKIEDLGLGLLFHISDPDLFYQLKYQPEEYYGTKDQHLEELENILKRHPQLKIQVAHMAGQPEHLDHLAKWFDQYPNLVVDTSSAKWMAREFSHHPEEVREFFITYQDRILFGTDIVTGRTDREPIPGYYYLRYLSLQTLLETAVRNLPLPLADPENNNETVINGLDLPMKVLRKIYWENSYRLYG